MIKKTVILSAGGTGGHVFPARALAEELLLRGFDVAVCTDTRGLKYFEGMTAEIPRHVISSGTYGAGMKGKALFMIELAKGFFQSMRLVSRIKPFAIVGFGGYPSVPAVAAGQALGVNTFLHEQNAILGLANKILLPRAKKIGLSYVETVGIKETSKAVLTGNPVRQSIADLSRENYPSMDEKITVMVVGGSQGAKVFSEIVPHALAALPVELQRKLHIIQQSRPEAIEFVRAIYQGTELDFEIKSFFDDMPERIKETHLFITRSGASTVAELTAAGRPAIYVPFPWNRDNQQVFNAEQVANSGGGWVMMEKDLTVERLKTKLVEILSDKSVLTDSAIAAKTLGQGNAAGRLADVVLQKS